MSTDCDTRKYVGTEQNCVICAADILDCVKELSMRADAMVSQIILLNLPGKASIVCSAFYILFLSKGNHEFTL